MTVTEKEKKGIYEGGNPLPHVKVSCESLILQVTPILTLLYTGHRLDLQEKYWRASWSRNTSQAPPQPYLTAPLAPSGSESNRQGHCGRIGTAAGRATSHCATSDPTLLEVATQTVLARSEEEVYLKKFQRLSSQAKGQLN